MEILQISADTVPSLKAWAEKLGGVPFPLLSDYWPHGAVGKAYGIVAAKGAIWYNESGTKPNTIVRFDPQTQQFQSWFIPSGGYIVRKMDVTPDGNPVMVNSTVNFVGMVEVK